MNTKKMLMIVAGMACVASVSIAQGGWNIVSLGKNSCKETKDAFNGIKNTQDDFQRKLDDDTTTNATEKQAISDAVDTWAKANDFYNKIDPDGGGMISELTIALDRGKEDVIVKGKDGKIFVLAYRYKDPSKTDDHKKQYFIFKWKKDAREVKKLFKTEWGRDFQDFTVRKEGNITTMRRKDDNGSWDKWKVYRFKEEEALGETSWKFKDLEFGKTGTKAEKSTIRKGDGNRLVLGADDYVYQYKS